MRTASSERVSPDRVYTQFRVTRIVLGLYLLYHFLDLIPYADELFGKSMLFDPTLGPTYNFFPNILNYVNPTLFLLFLVMNTIYFIVCKNVKISALILWYGWAALINRNVLISNPGIPYVGWILLLYVCELQNDPRHMKNLIWVAWFLMGLGYTISGIHKLDCPSWLDGSALTHVLNSPLGRDNFLKDMLLNTSPLFLKVSTWISLFLEISFLPFGLFYYTRPIYWFAYLFFHWGIVTVINFTDLTLGVFMIHVLTFDLNWFRYLTSIKFKKNN